MACAAQTFSNIDAAAWNCIKGAAKSQTGVDLATDSGTATEHGFTVTWNYDASAQTLTIQCVAKPVFVSCGTANQKIHDIVDGCTS